MIPHTINLEETLIINEVTYKAHITCTYIGNDILIILTGGKIHIGAISLAELSPDINVINRQTTTVSTLTLRGHKEDMITMHLAKEIAKQCEKHTVVIAGLHWDNLEKNTLSTLTDWLLTKVKKRIVLATQNKTDQES